MAKITDIKAIALEHDLGAEHAYGMARSMTAVRNMTLIIVETDAGVTGYGEAWGPSAVTVASVDVVKPYFLGRTIYDREQVAPYFYNQRYHSGIQNTLTAALGGINIALYDTIGKLHGVPLFNLLGGQHSERIPAYASNGYFAAHPDNQLVEQTTSFRDQRFPGVKIKIGASAANDAERCAAARDILGPDIALMVDANGNYTVDQALASMRAIAEYDIHFYEEPLPPTDFAGYTELRGRAPMAIAAGEAHYTGWDFKRLIDERCVDVLQPRPHFVRRARRDQGDLGDDPARQPAPVAARVGRRGGSRGGGAFPRFDAGVAAHRPDSAPGHARIRPRPQRAARRSAGRADPLHRRSPHGADRPRSRCRDRLGYGREISRKHLVCHAYSLLAEAALSARMWCGALSPMATMSRFSRRRPSRALPRPISPTSCSGRVGSRSAARSTR